MWKKYFFFFVFILVYSHFFHFHSSKYEWEKKNHNKAEELTNIVNVLWGAKIELVEDVMRSKHAIWVMMNIKFFFLWFWFFFYHMICGGLQFIFSLAAIVIWVFFEIYKKATRWKLPVHGRRINDEIVSISLLLCELEIKYCNVHYD